MAAGGKAGTRLCSEGASWAQTSRQPDAGCDALGRVIAWSYAPGLLWASRRAHLFLPGAERSWMVLLWLSRSEPCPLEMRWAAGLSLEGYHLAAAFQVLAHACPLPACLYVFHSWFASYWFCVNSPLNLPIWGLLWGRTLESQLGERGKKLIAFIWLCWCDDFDLFPAADRAWGQKEKAACCRCSWCSPSLCTSLCQTGEALKHSLQKFSLPLWPSTSLPCVLEGWIILTVVVRPVPVVTLLTLRFYVEPATLISLQTDKANKCGRQRRGKQFNLKR